MTKKEIIEAIATLAQIIKEASKRNWFGYSSIKGEKQVLIQANKKLSELIKLL